MKIKKKHLYLPVEVKVRELIPKILLSYRAILSGYRVYLGEKNEIIQILKHKEKKGGVLIYKGGLKEELFQIVKKKCDYFIILDEELSPMMVNELGYNKLNKEYYKFFLKQRYPKNLLSNIDRYFLWIKKDLQIVKNLIHNKKVVSTGNLKMDTWRKENLFIFEKEVKKIKKKYGKFILFNSDLRYINESEFESIFNKNNKILQTVGIDSKIIKKLYKLNLIRSKHKLNIFNDLYKLFADVENKLNNINIVIRPHPNEDVHVWREKFGKLKHVSIESPISDVTPYILAASGVMHNGCTTSIHSTFAKKPTSYFAGRYKNYLSTTNINKLLIENNFKILSSKDFIEWIKLIEKKKIKFNEKYHKKFVKHINFSKNSVSNRFLNEINNFSKNIFGEEKISERIYPKKKIIDNLVENSKRKILNFLIILKLRSARIKKIPNGISKLEIRKIINSLNFKKKKTSIRQISNQVFEIDISKNE